MAIITILAPRTAKDWFADMTADISGRENSFSGKFEGMSGIFADISGREYFSINKKNACAMLIIKL